MLSRVVCGFFVLLFAIPAMPSRVTRPRRVTVSFLLDHNRLFVDLEFSRPDGKLRKARAFVDMGGPDLTFTEGLAKELRLELEQAKKLDIRIGGTPLFIDQTKVTAEI
jgi:hypothetical protein